MQQRDLDTFRMLDQPLFQSFPSLYMWQQRGHINPSLCPDVARVPGDYLFLGELGPVATIELVECLYQGRVALTPRVAALCRDVAACTKALLRWQEKVPEKLVSKVPGARGANIPKDWFAEVMRVSRRLEGLWPQLQFAFTDPAHRMAFDLTVRTFSPVDVDVALSQISTFLGDPMAVRLDCPAWSAFFTCIVQKGGAGVVKVLQALPDPGPGAPAWVRLGYILRGHDHVVEKFGVSQELAEPREPRSPTDYHRAVAALLIPAAALAREHARQVLALTQEWQEQERQRVLRMRLVEPQDRQLRELRRELNHLPVALLRQTYRRIRGVELLRSQIMAESVQRAVHRSQRSRHRLTQLQSHHTSGSAPLLLLHRAGWRLDPDLLPAQELTALKEDML